jgi:hypothetical protein
VRRPAAGPDSGAALLLALLTTLVLVALGGGLIALGDTEAGLAHNHRAAGELRYAAEAVVERALAETRPAISWTDVLTGSVRSAVFPATTQPQAPWGTTGTTIDLAALTTELQAQSDAAMSAGLNNPTWRVFAAGAFDGAAGGATGIPQVYLVAWVADDPSETDNDPWRDANDIILVRGLALNILGMRVGVQVTVARVAGTLRVLAWRLVQ